MRYYLLNIFIWGISWTVTAQGPITHVSATKAGGEVTIRYDLNAPEGKYYTQVSIVNDSLSQTTRLLQLTGDVNLVKPGTGKIIRMKISDVNVGFPVNKIRFQVQVFQMPDNVSNMVLVEEGTFMMGSESTGEDAVPVHPVTVNSFYLAQTEVTVAEYLRFCRDTNHPVPEGNTELNDQHPITFVSWYDATAYLDWLSKTSGLPYRLPTEAEWEFAAKGGNYSRGLPYSGSENVNDVGWYNQNSLGSMHHAVGGLKPNEVGLFDMSGNVWEWCQDWYNSKFYSISPSKNPSGPTIGKVKVGRGGSWYNKAVPIEFRYFLTPQSKTNYVGFRVALSAASSPLIAIGSGKSEVMSLAQPKTEMAQARKQTEPPAIQVINPVIERGPMISFYGPEIKIKGRVTSKSKLLLLLVNGMDTPVDENGYFERGVLLKYFENAIQLRAIDADQNIGSISFTVNREMNEADVDRNNSVKRGTNYALLIGTDTYKEFANLNNPVFDVKTISDELKQSYGFEVNTVTGPSLEDFYSTLRSYGSRKYSSLDQLFIFVAGHGVFDEVFGDGYLVLTDSRDNDQNKTSYISHSNLRTILNNIDCPHIFLVLDVCFGGTFDPLVAHRGDEYEAVNRDQFIHQKLQYRTRQYLTSGGKTYVSDGRPGSHSPFAREFIQALRSYGGADRILTINEIVGFVEKVQPEPRRGEFGSNEPGSDFLFIKKDP